MFNKQLSQNQIQEKETEEALEFPSMNILKRNRLRKWGVEKTLNSS